eukprot:m.103450 g.103450  ORF g.103450 m.103450 type:complete len:837 (+) comp10478_c2_seq1:1334-3844(+)
MSFEVRAATVLKDVTFTTVCGMRGDKVAYITENETSGRVLVHVLKTGSDTAATVCESFQKAFIKAKEYALNPFKPTDGSREKPPAHLFEHQIRRGHLEAINPVGAGQFGQVWQAKLSPPDSAPQTVAVKMLRDSASTSQKDEFVRECTVMLDLQHPNMAQILGVCVQQKPWLCVLEFIRYGDLRNILQSCDEKGLHVAPEVVLSFASQVADGMAFLAERQYVHVDLAARNLLLDVGNKVKIADFGLAQKVEANGSFFLPLGVKLPMKWMSIEAMDSRIFSEASDIWAFGVTVWELFSYGATPYEGIANLELQDLIRDGLRPDEPDEVPDGVYDYMLDRLWTADPTERATFKDVVVAFREFASEFPAPSGDLGHDLTTYKPNGLLHTRQRRPRWYHGTITASDAKALVLAGRRGDYLIRDNDDAGGGYALLVKDDDNHCITISMDIDDDGKITIEGDDEHPHSSLDELVARLSMGQVALPGGVSLGKACKHKSTSRPGSASSRRSSSTLPETKYDATTDRSWYVGRMKKVVVDDIVASGSPGDFLVRSKKDGLRHYIVLHDGGNAVTFSIDVAPNGVHSMGSLAAPTLDLLVARLVNRTFRGRNVPFVKVTRPAPLTDTQRETLTSPNGGAASGVDSLPTSPLSSAASTRPVTPVMQYDGFDAVDNADTNDNGGGGGGSGGRCCCTVLIANTIDKDMDARTVCKAWVVKTLTVATHGQVLSNAVRALVGVRRAEAKEELFRTMAQRKARVEKLKACTGAHGNVFAKAIRARQVGDVRCFGGCRWSCRTRPIVKDNDFVAKGHTGVGVFHAIRAHGHVVHVAVRARPWIGGGGGRLRR